MGRRTSQWVWMYDACRKAFVRLLHAAKETVWFMSWTTSPNTIITCNFHFVATHSQPSASGNSHIYVFFPIDINRLSEQSLALSTYSCVLPLHRGPIINHLEGPVSTFSSPRGLSWHWASEATRLPPPLRGLVGGLPCCRLAPSS